MNAAGRQDKEFHDNGIILSEGRRLKKGAVGQGIPELTLVGAFQVRNGVDQGIDDRVRNRSLVEPVEYGNEIAVLDAAAIGECEMGDQRIVGADSGLIDGRQGKLWFTSGAALATAAGCQ